MIIYLLERKRYSISELDSNINYIIKPNGEVKKFNEPHISSLAKYLNDYFQTDIYSDKFSLIDLINDLIKVRHSIYINLSQCGVKMLFTLEFSDIPINHYSHLHYLITDNTDDEFLVLANSEELDSSTLLAYLVNKIGIPRSKLKQVV